MTLGRNTQQQKKPESETLWTRYELEDSVQLRPSTRNL